MLVSPYTVNQIEDQAHGNAKLLEVQAAITIDICQIPYSFQLVVAQLTVLQDRGCLGAIEMGTTIRKRGKDFPVTLDLPLLDALRWHAVCRCVARGMGV